MKTLNQINYYFQVYLEEAEYVRGIRKETLISYQSLMKTFFRRMPELSLLEDLTPTTVKEFFKRTHREAKVKNKTIKNSTIYTYHSKLNAFFGWLENQHYISRGSLYNVIPKPEQPQYNDVKNLNEREVETLIATVSLESVNDSFLSIRNITILYIFLYTGIRRSELLGLRIQDIDFDNQSLYIRAQTSKSKKGRNIPLNSLLLITLKKYFTSLSKRKKRSSHLFVSRRDTPLTRHGLKSWVEKYSKLSGVKFSMHQLRHTFACRLAQQNADIVSIKCALGHSSIQMTERYLRSIGSENTRVFIERLCF